MPELEQTKIDESSRTGTALEGLQPVSDEHSVENPVVGSLDLFADGLLRKKCISCVRGFHWECDANCTCDHKISAQIETLEEVEEGSKARGYYKTDPDEIKDAFSTGRKRAVQIKPITEGMICEWSGLERAGGIIGIRGCNGNLATNVHHGPDKNTLNNEWTNLHRICAVCHNRWHGINDPKYHVVPDEMKVWTKEQGNPQYATIPT